MKPAAGQHSPQRDAHTSDDDSRHPSAGARGAAAPVLPPLPPPQPQSAGASTRTSGLRPPALHLAPPPSAFSDAVSATCLASFNRGQSADVSAALSGSRAMGKPRQSSLISAYSETIPEYGGQCDPVANRKVVRLHLAVVLVTPCHRQL